MTASQARPSHKRALPPATPESPRVVTLAVILLTCGSATLLLAAVAVRDGAGSNTAVVGPSSLVTTLSSRPGALTVIALLQGAAALWLTWRYHIWPRWWLWRHRRDIDRLGAGYNSFVAR